MKAAPIFEALAALKSISDMRGYELTEAQWKAAMWAHQHLDMELQKAGLVLAVEPEEVVA